MVMNAVRQLWPGVLLAHGFGMALLQSTAQDITCARVGKLLHERSLELRKSRPVLLCSSLASCVVSVQPPETSEVSWFLIVHSSVPIDSIFGRKGMH